MTRRFIVGLFIAAYLASVAVVAQKTDNAMNTTVRIDSSGNLLVAGAVVGGGTQVTATLPNQQLTIDSSGNLLVAINGGTVTPNSICLDATNKDSCLTRSSANTIRIATTSAGTTGANLQIGDGTASAPSFAFVSQTGTGLFYGGSNQIGLTSAGSTIAGVTGSGFALSSAQNFGWSSGSAVVNAMDTILARDAANTLAMKNGTTSQTLRVYATTTNSRFIDVAGANLVTAPTDSTEVTVGSVTRFREQSTITPASGGAGNCGTAFAAAALTADCTIATLPAGMKLVAVYADVTVGFTCSATCTGTKVVQAGTAAGGTQVLAAGLNVAATGTFGLADADLGSGMTRAAAIQGGLIGSWSGPTIISARFTSGTGNWGNGSVTNVNAGAIKFTLITEQVK